MVRPSRLVPFSLLIADSASSGVAISTKPKPRERPVSRSVTTLADSTLPQAAKASRSRSVEVEKESPPTKSLTAMVEGSLWPSECLARSLNSEGEPGRGLTGERVHGEPATTRTRQVKYTCAIPGIHRAASPIGAPFSPGAGGLGGAGKTGEDSVLYQQKDDGGPQAVARDLPAARARRTGVRCPAGGSHGGRS